MRFAILYEWVDCQGEVEDFIALEGLSQESNFFKFPDAKIMFLVDEEADNILKDYKEK